MAFSPAECWCSPKKMQVDYVDKPYYSVISEWDGFWPAGLCLTVKFWEENTCFLFWQQKFLSRTQLLPTYWRQHLQQAKLGSWFVCFLCFESLHGPWSAVKRRLIWQTRLNIAHQEGQEVWYYIWLQIFPTSRLYEIRLQIWNHVVTHWDCKSTKLWRNIWNNVCCAFYDILGCLL